MTNPQPATRRISITYILIAINVAVFLWELATGGDAYPNGDFHDHGQMFRGAVQAGEGWRILSAAFEHFGWAHIGLNMFALWQLGRVNEAVFGRIRFLLIYAIGIVGSGFAINAFEVPREPSAGASGAIFALFGALVAVGLRLGPKGSDLIKSVLPIIVINLVFTFSVPGISIAAHVGGLLSGFVAGLLLYQLPRPVPPPPPEAVAYRNLAHDPRAVVTIEHPPIESAQSQSQSQQ